MENYYPKKENYFIKHTSKLNIKDFKGTSKFDFNNIKIEGVILEREDGLYDFDLKVPDFIEVGEIDIQSLPKQQKKIDNWGYLVGVSYGQNLNSQINFINLNTYIRYKKLYIGIEGSTDGSLSGGVKVEF